ncbi:DNA-binding MarR family transcriptional regulator [Lachnospiraceae bacterium PM6-15]|uniref:winged helix DNA-binding protein n=1 Tax=Ohessyouella blattaphilus TaxID=2949333 RepID=UPI003E32BC2F
MNYLRTLLNIDVEYRPVDKLHLPNYIISRYRIRKAVLDGVGVFFLYPIIELEAIGTLKKHIARIKQVENIPVVLILEHLSYRKKEYLLREKIPFVVKGRQVYLPFMAVYLQERADAEKIEKKELLPASQVVLLYFIYHGSGRQIMSQAVIDLGLTSTSVSRAVRQLEELGLIKTDKDGVQKILRSELSAAELFKKARHYFQNPVKKTIYVPNGQIGETLLESGYTALAEYSMLNEPNVVCYAADSVSKWDGIATKKLQDGQTQAAVELWRYNPRKLSSADTVDPLSLALALKNDVDERVEEAVEEMLSQVWRRIDGNGN